MRGKIPVMLPSKKILPLIGQIYDAAADTALWPLFLTGLIDQIGASSAMLSLHDLEFRRGSVLVTAGIDPSFAKKYNDYYGRLDCWARAGSRLLIAGAVLVDEMMCPGRELIVSEFYNDFLVPQNHRHDLCGVLFNDERGVGAISIQRSKAEGAFGETETILIDAILPHLQRAMQFHRRIAELEGESRTTLDAVDRLSTAVLLLDANGRVLRLNRSAQSLLNQNDGLHTKNGRLVSGSQRVGNELDAMIAACARTAGGGGVSAGGVVSVGRPSGKRAFNVLVMPASRNMPGDGPAKPAVIAFVTDPHAMPQVGPEALRKLFLLSPAECRVAACLMQGDSLVQVACKLEVSHNTVRTHLQSIFQKTDTTHQGQLIGLLNSCLPGIAV